jgi:membrane protease YdiL (CAAX protease family)
MIGVMAVIIFFASVFSSDLQKYYPLYLKSGGADFANTHQWPEWLTVLIYEASYLFNFVSIEFFFRGFFILTFVRIFGPQIILPVACVYASIHFGKPFLESLGSIFGGYILGILTYKTENIWGGVVVHAGTALLMELFAWLI